MTKAIKVTGVLAIILALIGAVCLGVYTYSGAYALNYEDVTGTGMLNMFNISYTNYFGETYLPDFQGEERSLPRFRTKPGEGQYIVVEDDSGNYEDIVSFYGKDQNNNNLPVVEHNFTSTNVQDNGTIVSGNMYCFEIGESVRSIKITMDYFFPTPVALGNTRKAFYCMYNNSSKYRVEPTRSTEYTIKQTYSNLTQNTYTFGEVTDYNIYKYNSVGTETNITAIGDGFLRSVAVTFTIPVSASSEKTYICPISFGYGTSLSNKQGQLAEVRPSFSETFLRNVYGEAISSGITPEELAEAVANAEMRGYQNGLSIAQNGSWLAIFTAVFDAPVNTLFGTYNRTTGAREGGLFNLTLPLGETTLDLQGFFMGIVSIIVLLCVVRLILRFIK